MLYGTLRASVLANYSKIFPKYGRMSIFPVPKFSLHQLKTRFANLVEDFILAGPTLSKYGVLCNEHRWFTNYLSNRKQAVSCRVELSTRNNITAGGPQGSVLGSLLFILFINDITQVLI